MGAKGVSPLIATILLIATVIAIAGIISIWLTSFTKTQTSVVESTAEKQIKCSASSLAIEEARYNSTSIFVNVTVTYETGTEKLYNLTVEASGGGRTNSSTAVYTADTDPFESGESRAVSINTSGGASIPPEYVRARAYCQGSVGIVGECKSGQPCMKQV